MLFSGAIAASIDPQRSSTILEWDTKGTDLNDFLDVDHFLNDLFNFHWHFNNFLDLMEQGYQIWGALAPSCSAMGVPGH